MHKESLWIAGRLQGMELYLAAKAVYFMEAAHKGQMRDDKTTDYAEHPTRVCRMLICLKMNDDVTLSAALLHDVVEDKRSTLMEIEHQFGADVAHLVDLLSKREGMSFEEYYRRVHSDLRAVIIKAADRACNVHDMTEVYTVERMEKYISDSQNGILPIMKVGRRADLKTYSDPLIILRDYINGILSAARRIVDLLKENVELKKTIGDLKGEIEDLKRKLQSTD
jgi:(p)ppGpp synthase/HD superfamily hydrolase